jgi:glycosyltransferase involved in cell wall biosynthesis
MRVLHLNSAAPDFQAEYAAAALARRLGAEFTIATRRLGQVGTGRNFLGSLRWLRDGRRYFDVIHAWDFASARIAATARRAVVFSPSEGLRPSEIWWLKWMTGNRGLRVVCAAEAYRSAFERAGIPRSQLHVAPPPVQVSEHARDLRLRQSLGLAPDDRVLLAPGESTRAAGHRYALWAASILHVLDPRWRLLVWGRGPQVQSLRNLAANFRQPRVLCMAEQTLGKPVSFESLFAAADLALITPHGLAPSLPIQMCMAGGLPIVAAASPVIDDWLNSQTAAIVPRLSPRLLAQRVLAMMEDEPQRRRLAENARRKISGAVDHYADVYRSLYRQAVLLAHR